MDVKLYPAPLAGTVAAPPSKSRWHRELICQAAAGRFPPLPPDAPEDIRATAAGLRVLYGGGEEVPCGASGSTLRFLLPLAMTLGREVTFTGTPRLLERVMPGLWGVTPCPGGLRVTGRLTGGVYHLPGGDTSQLISGMLMALPLCREDSRLEAPGPVSRPYVDLTVWVLERYGVVLHRAQGGWRIPGGQRFAPLPIELEGDWSAAAYWLVLAALVGCVVGPLGGAFGLALNGANATRGAHPWLLYLLPVAGLVIVFLYHRFDPDGGGSTNQIFVSVREHKPLTLRTAPLIFVSTVATHLFGGSSGREGAALLLGGSVSGQLGRALRLENRDCRLMTMCGMAGAFSAIFGTPLAATIFTLEVVDVGSMQYAALLPCLVSALLGVFISGKMGLAPEAFVLQAEAAPTPDNLVRVIILGALLAALSIFFCELLHVTPKLYRKFFPNIYLRVAAGGVLIIALTKLLGTTDYNGAGAAVIEAAIDGEAVPYAFLLKMLFTALTLGAGFKGGEIVPIFFTGATFGCVAAPLLGLPPQLGAALGMVALFCGCTNSPLASICLAIEVFGGQCVSLFALACAVSYMLSSYFSLYREQHFLHSKLRIVGVQRVHGHWSETDAAHLTTNDDGEN